MDQGMLHDTMRLLVVEFGSVHGVDTSNWEIRSFNQGCTVGKITSAEEAAQFREWLSGQKDFVTDIAAPNQLAPFWSVVAVGDV